MNLSEKYIAKLMSLAGLLNENRIDKLRSQRVPEDIINTVIQFSKKTVKNPEDENLIQQNQYIPWFASELKLNEKIINDARLKVIINWINQSNFPKFPSNMPFDKVYETAVKWFESKNIDPLTLKEISGGKAVINYPDGSKWIIVKDKNFCMKVGEERGWCFSEIGRAKEFVKSKGGYMLVNKDGSVKIAIQFDKAKKELIDFQGAFNKVPDKNSAMKSADLISKLGEILNIDFGHNNTINQTIKMYPDFKKLISSLFNIKILPLNRYLLGIDINQEQLMSIPVESKLKFKIPLTDEEIKEMSPDLKLKHKIPLTDEEIKNLSPIAKLANGYKIKSAEIKSLPMFMQKIIAVMRGYDEPHSVFGYSDFNDKKMYSNFEANNKEIQLYIGDDWRDWAGFSDEDESAFYYVENHYAVEEGESREEKQMSYHMLGKQNEKLLKTISNFLKTPIDEESNNGEGIWDFINEFLPNSEDIKRIYISEIYEKKSDEFAKVRDKMIRKEQRFKIDFNTDVITFPWTKLLRYIAEKNFNSNDVIEDFEDLKDSDVNKITGAHGYGLDDAWQNIWPKPKDLSYMQEEIERLLEEDLEQLQTTPEVVQNSEEAGRILRNLGFISKNGERNSVKMPDGDFIEVLETNIHNRKFKIRLLTKKGVKEGFIPFENLAHYVTMKSLFEEKVRATIRKILFEGGNFRYSDTNDNTVATFKPSGDVIKTAQQALQAVQNNKLVQSDASNEGSGIQKANSLSNAELMTHAQLKRMEAFFTNNEQAVNQELAAGKNINNSPLIQKWNLWGGNAGRNWVRQQLKSQESSNQTKKKIRNPEDGVDTKTLMNPLNTRIKR